MGAEKPGIGHSYRVQGPTFQIEFVNRSQKFLRLGVRDFGPGIPDEQRDQLFTEFGLMSTENNKGGSGLGLFICLVFAKVCTEGEHF